jgi:hypothetical protein
METAERSAIRRLLQRLSIVEYERRRYARRRKRLRHGGRIRRASLAQTVAPADSGVAQRSRKTHINPFSEIFDFK